MFKWLPSKEIIVGLIKVLLSCSMLLLLPLSAVAMDEAKMHKQMLGYIDYIVGVSSLKYNGEKLPKIKVMSANRLKGYVYTTEALLEEERTGEALSGVNAAYYYERDEMLINEDLDLEKETEFGPTLVHELVHYLQDINGITEKFGDKTICLEGEAYDIQALWQIENNVRPEEYAAINQQILVSFMQCEQQFKQ